MKTRTKLAGAVLLVLVVGAVGASAQTSGVIYACASNRSGTIRLVSTADACARGEYPINWNTVGPQGPAGPAGPQGPAGAADPGLAMGTITGKLIGCHVGGRVVSIPGKSLMAVTAAQGDFEIQRVPFSPHLLAIDLGSAQRQIGTVTVSEAGQDPPVLDLVLDDFSSDNNNCGACGHVCGQGTTCQAGVCSGGACTPGDSCTAGFGICAEGTRTCDSSGAWTCSPINTPQPETCNGLDDNCDGQIDEGALCPAEQHCQLGQCQAPAVASAAAGQSTSVTGTDLLRHRRKPRR